MAKEPGLVSVLIVAYNAAATIGPTIESCLRQTYNRFEILVLDNHSADATSEIVERFRHPKIRLFHNDRNIGPYRGLNLLLDRSSGDYAAIQDHDDIWLPSKIELQVEFLDRHPGFIACGTGTYNYYESKGAMIADGRTGTVDFVAHSSLVFRNRGFRYDPKVLLADEHFERIVLGRQGPIHCLGEPLTIHRIRAERKNFSFRRFRFTPRNIKEVLDMRGLRAGTLLYLAGILAAKRLPTNVTWLVLTQRKKALNRLSIAEFRTRHPDVRI